MWGQLCDHLALLDDGVWLELPEMLCAIVSSRRWDFRGHAPRQACVGPGNAPKASTRRVITFICACCSFPLREAFPNSRDLMAL